ncbi:MAG: HAMP domain-containing histidine kinase [Clostridium sp.]|nr:HAMP domain-containing histidine kinase [Clostridium sp.]
MKSIFSRLFLTYVLIIAVAIALFSGLLSVVLREHLFLVKQDSLLETGYYLNTLLGRVQRGTLTEKELALAVNVAGETANARVVLLEKPVEELPAHPLLSEMGNEWLADLLTRIWQGETVIIRRQFAAALDTEVVAVGMPSRIGGRVTGAVILFSPLNELEGVLAQARNVVWLSGSLLLLLAFVVVYFVSHRLTRPVVKVSRAAEALAGGKDIPDLEEGGKDELGMLVESFNQLKNKLKKAETMRRELIAGVSHELRSPLAAIRGFVQGMLDDVIPPRERPRYLNLVLQETNRLTAMTNDLLEMARLESGGIVLRKEKFDLCIVVKETAELFSAQAHAKNLEINLRGCDKELLLTADSSRVRQVIGNLLSNAVEFTPAGGSVGINVSGGQDTVMIEVWDTGLGISAQDLPFVFEKFYRVEKFRDSATGGTGLGLAIVKSIVELHGGQIALESSCKGTVARIVFSGA